MTLLIRPALALCLMLAGAACLAPGHSASAQSSTGTAQDARHLSLKLEVQHAIDRGLQSLAATQDENGHWSDPNHPAVTALALVAFHGTPSGSADHQNAIDKGLQYVLSLQKPGGGIYKDQLSNYNTAVSLLALVTADRPEFKEPIRKARQFIISLQQDYGTPGEIDNPLDGGIGYGNSYPHSDMSNTLFALEALYYSREFQQDQSAEVQSAKDLNWDAVLSFVQNCQNLPEHNSQEWASADPGNKGGFVYFPGNSKAGEETLDSGRTALRSYGSISYAGLLSYIYADLDKDDPRVQAVLDWLTENYTLEENPGMGPQGLFYYYHTMAKGLATYGTPHLITKDGRTIDWRKELALKLINLQQPDGSWINQNGRWWERDRALVTSYAVIALEFIHRAL